jgi:hypothetical protein
MELAGRRESQTEPRSPAADPTRDEARSSFVESSSGALRQNGCRSGANPVGGTPSHSGFLTTSTYATSRRTFSSSLSIPGEEVPGAPPDSQGSNGTSAISKIANVVENREEGAERRSEPNTELTKASWARTCARVLASMKRVGSRFDSHAAPTEIGGSARSELGGRPGKRLDSLHLDGGTGKPAGHVSRREIERA